MCSHMILTKYTLISSFLDPHAKKLARKNIDAELLRHVVVPCALLKLNVVGGKLEQFHPG